jgi:ribose/xylose/arabinose/galactoside ABC-type transport system permease subunit
MTGADVTEAGGDAPGRRAPDAGALGERLRTTGIALPFAALFIALSVTSSSFLTKVNLLNILDQQAATLIIAAAGTLVLVAGGIDLSVGAV